LSNYDFVTIRMSASGADPTVGVQYYTQTGPGFSYQSQNTTLTVDGTFYDLVFPLAGVTNKNFTDTTGINLFGHANDLVIRVDSVIYTSIPEPATLGLIGIGLIGCLGLVRRARVAS